MTVVSKGHLIRLYSIYIYNGKPAILPTALWGPAVPASKVRFPVLMHSSNILVIVHLHKVIVSQNPIIFADMPHALVPAMVPLKANTMVHPSSNLCTTNSRLHNSNHPPGNSATEDVLKPCRSPLYVSFESPEISFQVEEMDSTIRTQLEREPGHPNEILK